MQHKWICKDEGDTAQAARDIAGMLPSPAVVLLDGDLGAGKTAFCRALLRHLLNDDALSVPSPTYTLVQTYGNDDDIWHFDLYRMDNADDIYNLGWEDALHARLCLIEWPVRLGRHKPKNTVDISIEVLPDEVRHIKVNL